MSRRVQDIDASGGIPVAIHGTQCDTAWQRRCTTRDTGRDIGGARYDGASLHAIACQQHSGCNVHFESRRYFKHRRRLVDICQRNHLILYRLCWFIFFKKNTFVSLTKNTKRKKNSGADGVHSVGAMNVQRVFALYDWLRQWLADARSDRRRATVIAASTSAATTTTTSTTAAAANANAKTNNNANNNNASNNNNIIFVNPGPTISTRRNERLQLAPLVKGKYVCFRYTLFLFLKKTHRKHGKV